MGPSAILEVFALKKEKGFPIGDFIGVVEDEEFGRTLCKRVTREIETGSVMCWWPKAVPLLLNQLHLNFFIVDLMLGDQLRGIQVIEEIRRSGRRVCIVAISAYDHVDVLAMKAGADLFIDKGIGPDQALSQIRDRYRQWRHVTPARTEIRTKLLPCIVISVDDERAIVEMEIDGKTVRRVFPSSRLAAVGGARAGAELSFIMSSNGSSVVTDFLPSSTQESKAWRASIKKEIEEFKDDVD